MKYAVIDMGSNSIRLMLAEVQSGRLETVNKYLEMTRLGAGVDQHKTLSETAILATLKVVEKFKQQAETEKATLLGAFATSAVRDSINGKAFAERVLAETGVEVQILSGDEEAELGYLGVVSGAPAALANEKFLIIDIGGGSTELIVGDLSQIYYRRSFNVGAVRMTGKHVCNDPIEEAEAQALTADVALILAEAHEQIRQWKPTAAIGIGGTATSFGAMALKMVHYDRKQIHNAQVSLETLRETVAQLKRLTVAEKRELVGLMPKRADVIYAGGVILEYILESFQLESFYVSDYDNLEGILARKNIIG